MYNAISTDRCRIPELLDLWNIAGGLVITEEEAGPGGIEKAFGVTEPVTGSPTEFYLDWFFRTPAGQLYPRVGQFTISAYMKANGRTWAWLDAGNGVVDRFAYFDLANGVTGQTSGPDVFATIVNVGGGWWLCTMSGYAELYTETEELHLADDGTVSIGPADQDGGFGYNGNGTGIYVFGVAFDAPGENVEPYEVE